MKTLLSSLLFLVAFTTSYAQLTSVPDANFEAYLEANGMGNGVANDHLVSTTAIEGVSTLDVSSLGISDLTGIEDFTSLTNLHCESNTLDALNIGSNIHLTTLYCHTNTLEEIDVSTNTALKFFYCNSNNISSLDLSTNTALLTLECSFNNLTSLNLSNNTSLDYLDCGVNEITSLNLTSNYYLTHMYCYNNLLTSIDLRNFNNQYLTYFSSLNNLNLTCIYVDQVTWCQENWTDIDLHTHIVANEADCSMGVQSFSNTIECSIFPNPAKDNFVIYSQESFLKVDIYTIFGKFVKSFPAQNKYAVLDLPKGIYFVIISGKQTKTTKKLILK